MKLPSVPWKNIAAIGGAVRISVVRIRPMPPCCSTLLDWVACYAETHTTDDTNT
jgi:hypothetical protein